MALLKDHIAVVTGSASGIGRAIAVGYAREGAHVVLLDVNAQAAAEAAKEIRDGGGKATSFGLDVTRRETCFEVAKEIAGKVGQVSILCNNAGINRRNAFTSDPAVSRRSGGGVAMSRVGLLFALAFVGVFTCSSSASYAGSPRLGSSHTSSGTPTS